MGTLDYLTALPYEISYEVLMPLPYRDIIAYCKSNKRAYNICLDDKFWMEKLDRDIQYVNEAGVTVYASSYIGRGMDTVET